METIDADHPRHSSGIRLDWNINLGHILQAAVVVIGLVSWAIASAGRAEQTQRDLSGLKSDVGVQLRDLRESLNKDLDGIHQELRALSDQRIRMDAAEKGLAAQDGERGAGRSDQRARASVHRAARGVELRHAGEPGSPSGEMMDMVHRTLLCLALILSGCAAKPPAPVANSPPRLPVCRAAQPVQRARSRRPHRAPWRSLPPGRCRRITHARRPRTPGANARDGSIVYSSGSASTPAEKLRAR